MAWRHWPPEEPDFTEKKRRVLGTPPGEAGSIKVGLTQFVH